jgi:4-amino-4-deoxy-L-arabinose transferase-like glycosyltransferase
VGSTRELKTVRAGLTAGLGLALLGQIYFATRPDYLWDAVLFYTTGTAVLVWTVRRAGVDPLAEVADPAAPAGHSGVPQGVHRRAVLGAGLLALTGTLLLVAARKSPPAYWDAFGLWVLGITLTLASGVGQTLRPGREGWLVVALAGLGLGLRFYRLDQVPYIIDGDASNMGLEARRVLEGTLANMFATGWLSHPTLFFFLQAGAIAILGPDPFGLRFVSALLGGLSVPVLYLLGRELFDARVGLLAASFMAAYPFHIHYSRIGLNNIADTLFGPLVLFNLVRGVRTGQPAAFLVGGVSLGLSQYFYHGSRLIPFIAGLYVAYEAVRRPARVLRVAPGLGLFAVAGLLVYGPLGHFFLTHPQDFTARLAVMGVFQSGWFEREIAGGRSPGAILFDQLVRSFLAFNYYPDTAPHYAPGRPLLDFTPAVLFVLGLGLAACRVRTPGPFLTLGWFVLAEVFGNVLTVGPPFSARIVVAIPPVCILVALGLVVTVRLLGLAIGQSALWQQAAQLTIISVIAYTGLTWYFHLYGDEKYHRDPNTVVAMVAGQFIRAEGPSAVYLLGAPRLYYPPPTLAWVAYGVPGQDILTPLRAADEVPRDTRRPLLFIGVPERVEEAQFVQGAYVGGEFFWLFDPNGRQPIAWACVIRR